MVPIRQLFAKLYQFENRPHYNTSGTRRSSMVVGGIRYHQIHDAFHIVPDRRRLHKLLSPQIWCQLAGWILSYGQKPLAAGYTVAEGAMVWSLEEVLLLPKRCRRGSPEKSD